MSLDLGNIIKNETREFQETKSEKQMRFLLTYGKDDKTLHWQIKEPGKSEPFIMPDPEKEVEVDLTGNGDFVLAKKDNGQLQVLDTRSGDGMYEFPDDVRVVDLTSGDWAVNQGESGVTVDRAE